MIVLALNQQEKDETYIIFNIWHSMYTLQSSSQLYESVAPGTTMDTVSPLAASAVSAMLGTGVSERAREMQAFPPQSGMQLVPSNETSHVNAPSGSQTVPSSQTTIATQLQSSSQVSEQCQQDTNRPDNSMSVETEFTDVEPLQKQHVVGRNLKFPVFYIFQDQIKMKSWDLAVSVLDM